MTDLDQFIDDLAERAKPVGVQRTDQGRMILGIVGLLTVAFVAFMFGIRDDVSRLAPTPLITVATGLLAILSLAAGAHAVRMARPQVGASSSGTGWLIATLMLLPLAAIGAIAANPSEAAGLNSEVGFRCLMIGFAAGLGALAFLALWLRQGAPVAPEKASWLAGLAAGGIGAVAVTIECAYDSLAHLGVWHVAVVVAMAMLARLLLPPLVRW